MKWLSRFIVFAVASGFGVGAQDAPSQARVDSRQQASLGLLFSRYHTSPSAIKIRETSRE